MTNKSISAFILAIGILIILLSDSAVSVTKDRFNMYKGEEDDEVLSLLEDPRESKQSYFYRTPPLGFNSGLKVGPSPPDFGKRTINRYKNYMLTKDNQDEDIRKPDGGLFGWAITNRDNFEHE